MKDKFGKDLGDPEPLAQNDRKSHPLSTGEHTSPPFATRVSAPSEKESKLGQLMGSIGDAYSKGKIDKSEAAVATGMLLNVLNAVNPADKKLDANGVADAAIAQIKKCEPGLAKTLKLREIGKPSDRSPC